MIDSATSNQDRKERENTNFVKNQRRNDRLYPHCGGRTACPAYGKRCRKCGKMNHFQSLCRSESNTSRANSGKSKNTSGGQHRDIRNLSADSASDEHDLFKITVHNVRQDNAKHPLFNVEINASKITVMADSGSSINILDEQDYHRIQPRPILKDTNVNIYAYNAKSRLPVCGKFFAQIMTTRGAKSIEEMYGVKGSKWVPP